MINAYFLSLINKNTLHIKFNQVVYADDFFRTCSDIQCDLENGQHLGEDLSAVYIDLTQTTWFDTLSLCYLLMFADQSYKQHSTIIKFYLPSEPTEAVEIFLSYLEDNGFLAQMKNIGEIILEGKFNKCPYSEIHRCVWPMQIFHSIDEIEGSIELIKKSLRAELSSELSSYELENIIGKVAYFLQETLDNAYEHGYEESNQNDPCALLIRRVRSSDALNLEKYRDQYTNHTPYIGISLFEEKPEYLELFVADIGVGIRRSFLRDPDGKDLKITDSNILDFILSEGQRSRHKVSKLNRTRYGGLYDITKLFQEDGDKLGFKGDSRWFFEKTERRINSSILQHSYDGLCHGFAIVGSVGWHRRHSNDYTLKNELLAVVEKSQQHLFSAKNPWMRKDYLQNLVIRDYRFSIPQKYESSAKTAVLFPPKYFGKEDIITLLSECKCDSVIISGIHESEYKKYKTTVENLKISKLKVRLNRVIIITNTLFPYVFVKDKIDSNSKFVFSISETKNYILSATFDRIISSFIGFRLWKKVYDSEQLWNCLAEHNHMGYINAQIKWDNRLLRGYLDFSQLYLIPECRNLCIEQLIGFQLYYDHLYFYSLDRFTDEICEQANNIIDNSRDGTPIWIGSVFVSGTSERKLNSEARDEKNVFYFFKHADCETSQNVRTIFEWATQAFRIDKWFDPKQFKAKNYARVGESSFVAENGNYYWTSKHYANWAESLWLEHHETYQIVQKQFGAHPAILKMGHFDAIDHHDIFEIKVDSLVETDIITGQINLDASKSSYDFLLLEFLRALVESPKEDHLIHYLRENTPTHKMETIRKRLKPAWSGSGNHSEKNGLVVYLSDYHTSKIIESIKSFFSNELQQRIVPVIPIEKRYASSTLLISPLMLDALEKHMQEIRQYNKSVYNEDSVTVTLFIATSFTTRLLEELKHIMLCMGATQVRSLSIFDRQRLPYGNYCGNKSRAFARLDIPAIGFPDTCPMCIALRTLRNLHNMLRDDCLAERVDTICSHWSAVKVSDNDYLSGIAISHINLPNDVKETLNQYQRIHQQKDIEINTDLGLCLFSVESTAISLSLDFLDACLKSEQLGSDIKVLLLSAHILTFDYLQLSEKHFCRLLETLCDLLAVEKKISEFTALAVIAVCGQTQIFQKYVQNYMERHSVFELQGMNNDYLLLKLSIYQALRTKNVEASPEYRRELHCYLKNEKNALELIYDLFLYAELEYNQSHRQAFGQMTATSMKTSDAVYRQALQYIQKMEEIYRGNLIVDFFHDSTLLTSAKDSILHDIESLKLRLQNIKNDEEHLEANSILNRLLRNIQMINKGLYLRATENAEEQNILAWLDYCERKAKERCGTTGDKLLKIIEGYKIDANSQTDVYPWFYAYADVTEEVINLIVDMMLRRTSKLRDFMQSRPEESFDGIIVVQCKKPYVELSFYNATSNSMPIEEIRRIKKSKENRPTIIVFRQFERIISANIGERKVPCFEWDYAEEQHDNYLACEKDAAFTKHLFRATMRLPYVDMGSAFGH